MRYKSFIVFMFIGALPCACLEMNVSTVAKTENPIVQRDAAADADLGPQEACRACLAAPEDPGPGCQMPYSACNGEPKCKAILDCGFEVQCFQGAQRAFLGCALPCVTKQVLLPDDPVLNIATGLFQCLANGPCGEVCFDSE
jgi:hypothetical protein